MNRKFKSILCIMILFATKQLFAGDPDLYCTSTDVSDGGYEITVVIENNEAIHLDIGSNGFMGGYGLYNGPAQLVSHRNSIGQCSFKLVDTIENPNNIVGLNQIDSDVLEKVDGDEPGFFDTLSCNSSEKFIEFTTSKCNSIINLVGVKSRLIRFSSKVLEKVNK